jgi:metallo-beta-lactamase family protein
VTFGDWKMIELEFLGAAQTVTGSKHLLRTSSARVLLDCGLFQGHRAEALRRTQELPVEAQTLDAVVLSHAHIDHSGALPLLFKRGYRGPVYATPATRDLSAPMLLDAANIQESDARHLQHMIRAGHADIAPVEPLYSADDAKGIVAQMVSLPYHQRVRVASGVDATFLDAGHVLGSAITVLDVEDGGRSVRIAFTGDLGRRHIPILRDPEVPDGAEHLLMESTYGDRLHDPIEQMTSALGEVVAKTVARGGKVIIPSFALERAQEVVFGLKSLQARGKLPAVPVYVDSPLTVKLTDVFKRHPECYDEEASALLHGGDSPFELDGLRYISEVEDSKAIDAETKPSIIISASGMCESGRVLHHLRATIGSAKNTVLIVGFQAEHTLGRRLVERQRQVRIFGVMFEREAEVVVLNGFSAHADQRGLLDYAREVGRRGSLKSVFLVHGEPPAQRVLAEKLRAESICSNVTVPAAGDRVRLA